MKQEPFYAYGHNTCQTESNAEKDFLLTNSASLRITDSQYSSGQTNARPNSVLSHPRSESSQASGKRRLRSPPGILVLNPAVSQKSRDRPASKNSVTFKEDNKYGEATESINLKGVPPRGRAAGPRDHQAKATASQVQGKSASSGGDSRSSVGGKSLSQDSKTRPALYPILKLTNQPARKTRQDNEVKPTGGTMSKLK